MVLVLSDAVPGLEFDVVALDVDPGDGVVEALLDEVVRGEEVMVVVAAA